TDPLNAWQREGYEMFEQLWDGIDDDYLQYVMHAQVVLDEETEQPEGAGPGLESAAYSASSDPLDAQPTVIEATEPALAARGGQERGAAGRAPAGRPVLGSQSTGGGPPVVPGVPVAGGLAGGPDKQKKLGRNDPCWCGSGRKYKLCHGAN
ncbi:MAG: SEC-C metal-binding domain-containing protein, partial [Acidimicrobiales bacterium]